MHKTRAAEIIQTFSPEEIKDFTAFVRSPYFNTNKNLVKLFDALRKNLKKIEAGKVTEENLFQLVFGGKQYNYGIMKNLISSLASLCEEFLVINSIRSKPLTRYKNRVLLADEYDTRRLDRYYDKAIRSVLSDLDKEPIDNYYYTDRALVEESKYFFCSSRSDDKGLEDAIYNEMIYDLCSFYRNFSRNMWKIHINIDNVNSKYEKDFIELLDKHIAFEKLSADLEGINKREYDYIKLNTLLIKLLVNHEDSAPYYELKQILIDSIDSYENYERYSILTKALSYCSTAHRAGKAEFMRESLEMRRLVMEKVKFNHGGLGPFSFHYFIETIMIFLHENDPDGAEEFLEKNSHVVGPLNCEINYNLSMAYILETRGKYKEALGLLAKTWHDDTEINLRTRRLYIVLYYNMNEFEAGLDALNAFRSYVRGNPDLTDNLREKYLLFAHNAEKIFKIRAMPEKYSREDLDKLNSRMKASNRIMSKWLTEKLEELKEKFYS